MAADHRAGIREALAAQRHHRRSRRARSLAVLALDQGHPAWQSLALDVYSLDGGSNFWPWTPIIGAAAVLAWIFGKREPQEVRSVALVVGLLGGGLAAYVLIKLRQDIGGTNGLAAVGIGPYVCLYCTRRRRAEYAGAHFPKATKAVTAGLRRDTLLPVRASFVVASLTMLVTVLASSASAATGRDCGRVVSY